MQFHSITNIVANAVWQFNHDSKLDPGLNFNNPINSNKPDRIIYKTEKNKIK